VLFVKYTSLLIPSWLMLATATFGQGLSQSGWQQPSAQPQLGQSGWQQPSAQPQLGQSGWQQPSAQPQLGQSGWQQPSAQPQLGQSGWQQPQEQNMQPPPGQINNQNAKGQPSPTFETSEVRAKPSMLKGNATATKTLGETLNQEQNKNASISPAQNPDIDPAAASLFMNQLHGNAATASSTATGQMDPASQMMSQLGGNILGNDEAMQDLSKQLAPALNVLMQAMPKASPGQPVNAFRLPMFPQPQTRRYSQPVQKKPANPVNNILPTSTIRNLIQNAASRGLNQAVSH
jgi:hypothetical protein